MFNDLSDLTNVPPTPVADELTAYLHEDHKMVKNVIGWWQEKQRVYPQLLQIALDYHISKVSCLLKNS